MGDFLSESEVSVPYEIRNGDTKAGEIPAIDNLTYFCGDFAQAVGIEARHILGGSVSQYFPDSDFGRKTHI